MSDRLDLVQQVKVPIRAGDHIIIHVHDILRIRQASLDIQGVTDPDILFAIGIVYIRLGSHPVQGSVNAFIYMDDQLVGKPGIPADTLYAKLQVAEIIPGRYQYGEYGVFFAR